MSRILAISMLSAIVGLLPVSSRANSDAVTDIRPIYLAQNSSELAAKVINPAKKTNIWIGPEELTALEMQGDAWKKLKKQAMEPAGKPDLSHYKQRNNVHVLAKALVYARCKLETSHQQCKNVDLKALHQQVVDQIAMMIGEEINGNTLALGRKLVAYVIAADLVKLPAKDDKNFKTWLRNVRHLQPDSRSKKTLISTHEERPNNWGTHAGASRIAIAVYLDDHQDIQRSATVFKGWLGDRSAYSSFRYEHGLTWQCDPNNPVGINPKGCTKNGYSIDGVLADDQRRGGKFHWPPPKENYVYEALQGAMVQAVILHRRGYDTFNWQDQALLRAYRWLYEVADFPANGDDTWQLPLVDCYYGTSFWNGKKTRIGKNMGWTGWTHSAKNTGTCGRN